MSSRWPLGIVEADLWDRSYLDLVAPAMMTIEADGHGEIAFGALQASLDLEYSQSTVFFTWSRFDEMDEASGSGSAELRDDESLEIEFASHFGPRPSSRQNAQLLQQSARQMERPARWPHVSLQTDAPRDFSPCALRGRFGTDHEARLTSPARLIAHAFHTCAKRGI
jgi:hypothetical protein